MSDDGMTIPMIGIEPPGPGPMRAALEEEIGTLSDLSPALIAVCRALADEIDDLRRLLRVSDSPFTRTPLRTLTAEYREALIALRPIRTVEADPFEELLTDLAALDSADDPSSA